MPIKYPNLNMTDLCLLRFLTIDCNLTAAAKALNITQSAVSQRLAKIGLMLDQRLYVKNGKYVTLTDFGLSFGRRCAAAIEILETADGPNIGADSRYSDFVKIEKIKEILNK